MPVVQVYEGPLTVTLMDGGGAAKEEAVFTMEPKTVRLSGPDEILAGLQEISLGEINLAEVFEGVSVTLPIPIPEGVICRSGETEASISFSFANLSMKPLSADQIRLENVPKGYKASLVTESLQVWIRGSQAALDRVTPAQVRVVVDLTDAVQTIGQQWVPATAFLDGVSDAGVVGRDYSVAVYLGR